MKNITVKTSVLIHPLFNVAFTSLEAKELPIPLMKQVRRIGKKIREEMKEIQEDTKIIIRDVFGDRFTDTEVNTLVRGGKEKLDKILGELSFSPEKQEDFKKSLEAFEAKSLEVGEILIEIPFPKIVLPESITFRSDFAEILEDVIDSE